MFGWTVDTANPTKPQLVTEYNCERCATLSVLVPVLPLLVMVLLHLSIWPRSNCLLLLTRV